jgi:hypothetical protein
VAAIASDAPSAEHALEAGDVEFCGAAAVAERAMGDASLPERDLVPVEVDPATYPVE